MIDPSVALALCALLIYGVTQVISKQVVHSLQLTSLIAVNFVVSLPVYGVFLVATLLLVDLASLPPIYILYGFLGAGSARIGYYLYLEALEKGAVTMVGSVTAAYPAITAGLAITLLGESLQPVNALGITVIIASMVGLSYSHGRSTEGSSFSRAALLLSTATLLLWGFGGVFIKLSLSEIPLIAYLGLYPFLLPPIAFAYLRHKGATRDMLLPKWTVPVIGAVVITELWQLGYFAETSAVSEGAASIVFPLISAYPVVTIALARFLLKERLSGIDWTLLAAVIVGVVLTSVA